jgi:orotidine-5'-phosphate decarboxylase
MLAKFQAEAVTATRRIDIPLRERVIVALDVETVKEAEKIVEELDSLITIYKIGMQLQYNGGIPYAQKLIKKNKNVFLDSKLFDIGNTIERTVERISDMGVTFLTVHGDKQIIESAVRAKRNQLQVLAVTVLTDNNEGDLRDMLIDLPLTEFVEFRAKVALSAGADGVIASGQEAKLIRQIAGQKMKILTPGIRPFGASLNDQFRVSTPTAAIAAGADYLIVGRPILNADDKRRAAEAILAEVASVSRELSLPIH